MATKTAILLIHFKDSPHTLPCLDSLQKACSHTHFATYILSVQSNNKLLHPLNPKIIEEKHNKGFAWANNILIRQAMKDGYDAFILLNNDTIADDDFISPLIAHLSSPNVAMVCPKIFFYPGREFHNNDYQKEERGKVIWFAGGIMDWSNVVGFHQGVNEVDHGQWDRVEEIEFATGCCLAITKNTINKIGLMNEKYFLYYEDADWSIRAQKAGLICLFEPKSIIWHKNAGSTGGPGSDIHMYYQKRNRIYFGIKYAPLRTKMHLLFNAIKSRDKDSLDALLGHMGKQI
jgi:hypothetical protein